MAARQERIRARQADRRVGENVATVVLALLTKGTADVLRSAPGAHNVPFEYAYGHWRQVLVLSAVFLAFLLGFARPRRRGGWRNAGLSAAFLISLFSEMFRDPLTSYLLAPLLGLPAWTSGMNEGHLWAFALDRLGLLPLETGVYLVMTVSTVLIAAGLSLLAVGWATVYRGRDWLVTDGIYHYLRHPQYLGLMLIIFGFNIMWPTVLTLLMAPVLIVMYVRLAHREDEELATFFGETFLDYDARTRAFLPWGRGRAVPPRGTPERFHRDAEAITHWEHE